MEEEMVEVVKEALVGIWKEAVKNRGLQWIPSALVTAASCTQTEVEEGRRSKRERAVSILGEAIEKKWEKKEKERKGDQERERVEDTPFA